MCCILNQWMCYILNAWCLKHKLTCGSGDGFQWLQPEGVGHEDTAGEVQAAGPHLQCPGHGLQGLCLMCTLPLVPAGMLAGVCVCVHACVCVCECVCVCMHAYVHVCACMCMCGRVCPWACADVWERNALPVPCWFVIICCRTCLRWQWPKSRVGGSGGVGAACRTHGMTGMTLTLAAPARPPRKCRPLGDACTTKRTTRKMTFWGKLMARRWRTDEWWFIFPFFFFFKLLMSALIIFVDC